MARTSRPKRSPPALAAQRADYERAKAALRRLGFVFRGSLTVRRLPCGEPTCRCHADPKRLHGPYHQVSWKEGGKTVSRFLPATIVPSYREWVGNARTLQAIIDRMQRISRKAADAALTRETAKVRAARRTRK